MPKILWVGLGGFAGSILRYLFSGWIQQISQSASFPYSTLAVNALGCLGIGFLSQISEAHGLFTPEARLLLFVGLLGGFTTFSAFGSETLHLVRDGQTAASLINVASQLGFGLGAVWLGRALAFWIWR
jgi:CrcB protein